jgi:hypothetical protein
MTERGEIVNYLDLDPHLIRLRNEEMLRKVQTLWLEERLRAKNRRPRSGRSHTRNLTWRGALALVRGVGI